MLFWVLYVYVRLVGGYDLLEPLAYLIDRTSHSYL